MTDFDDGGIDLPDDDLTGGPDLSELDAADETLDLDLDAADAGDEGIELPPPAPRAPAQAAPRKAAAKGPAPARSGGKKSASKKKSATVAKTSAKKTTKKKAARKSARRIPRIESGVAARSRRATSEVQARTALFDRLTWPATWRFLRRKFAAP